MIIEATELVAIPGWKCLIWLDRSYRIRLTVVLWILHHRLCGHIQIPRSTSPIIVIWDSLERSHKYLSNDTSVIVTVNKKCGRFCDFQKISDVELPPLVRYEQHSPLVTLWFNHFPSERNRNHGKRSIRSLISILSRFFSIGYTVAPAGKIWQILHTFSVKIYFRRSLCN